MRGPVNHWRWPSLLLKLENTPHQKHTYQHIRQAKLLGEQDYQTDCGDQITLYGIQMLNHYMYT